MRSAARGVSLLHCQSPLRRYQHSRLLPCVLLPAKASISTAATKVWYIKRDSRVGSVAGFLLDHARGRPGASPDSALDKEVMDDTSNATQQRISLEPRSLPPLEAMGPTAIARAMNAIALCNRYLARDCASDPPTKQLRVVFVPSFRVFVQRPEDGQSTRSGDGQLRRSVQLHLRTLHCTPYEGAPGTAVDDEDDDLIRISVQTDVRRLSGLVSNRWSDARDGRNSSAVVLQAMGPRCINTLVRALAMSWQRSARGHEGDASEAGFACLPTHIQQPDDASDTFSCLQCELIPP